jgi:DNA-binding response OmpR family regulator
MDTAVSTSPVVNNRGKKILLVDDDQALRTGLAEQLDLYDGFTTIQVGTAAEGLEKAKLAHYDAVLLDIGLPDMDGNELARRLRADAATANAVLIAITGYGQEQDRAAAIDAGFDHHFVKPVDTARLASLLAEIGASRS